MPLLKQIEIVPGDLVRNAHRERDMKFQFHFHHVKEILLLNLGSKFRLDGSSKLRICCGPVEFGMTSSAPQTYEQSSNATQYVCDRFDFDEFYSHTGSSREALIVDFLETTLIDILSHTGGMSRRSQVSSASLATQESGFCAATKVPRLNANLGDIQLRVSRCLSQAVGESWKLDAYRKTDDVSFTVPVVFCPFPVPVPLIKDRADGRMHRRELIRNAIAWSIIGISVPMRTDRAFGDFGKTRGGWDWDIGRFWNCRNLTSAQGPRFQLSDWSVE